MCCKIDRSIPSIPLCTWMPYELKFVTTIWIMNKAVYLSLGMTMDGVKEVLGMWVADNEGATFWLQVVTELKNRSVQDIFIACVDGLKGFTKAIGTVFPSSQVQLCIVHMVRNLLNYVSLKTTQRGGFRPQDHLSSNHSRSGRNESGGIWIKMGRNPSIYRVKLATKRGEKHPLFLPIPRKSTRWTTNAIEYIIAWGHQEPRLISKWCGDVQAFLSGPE